MIALCRSMKPYVIVFTASGCTLIIEIVAGRILAPTIGVSLYTWTSIIGIVLAGISVGNYIGGRVADRHPSPSTLGLILLAGGVASIWILPMEHFVSGAFLALPIIPQLVVMNVALFLAPSVTLGMVTPVVIKLRLADLAETGNVVGKMYAASTAGSLLGTFLTGFFLVQLLGTRLVILIVAVVLVAMAVALGDLWRVRAPATVLGAVFAATIVGSVVGGAMNSGCIRESSYYCIDVRTRDIEGREVRLLFLDALVHSYVDTDDPRYLYYPYEKVFADIATTLALNNTELDTLFIGGGGYTMPKFMEVVISGASLEVVEIDPEVTRVAFDYLALPADTSIVTHVDDARTKLHELPQGKYEFIVGDAFNDMSVPYHLTTLEFNDMIRGLLSDNGVYAINVVDRLHSGRFLRSVVHTLQHSFPFVYVMRDDSRWDSDVRYTFVVMAAMRPITPLEVSSANQFAGRGSPVTRLMPDAAFKSWIANDRKVLLTDDYVPVDGMLAPLYLQSRPGGSDIGAQ